MTFGLAYLYWLLNQNVDDDFQGTQMSQNLEAIACQPHPLAPDSFNPDANLPYGCTTEHIRQAMNDFVDFLGFINQQLYTRGLERFESMLMPANFSSMVGEFMITTIPKLLF